MTCELIGDQLATTAYDLLANKLRFKLLSVDSQNRCKPYKYYLIYGHKRTYVFQMGVSCPISVVYIRISF